MFDTLFIIIALDLTFVACTQGLGIWVATQRETYNFEKETMPLERIQALDSLGFSWGRWGRQRSKARKDAWDKMFNELIEYKNVSFSLWNFCGHNFQCISHA